MIRRACTAVWYCDTCDAKWSYAGATHSVCDDKAKRDGWQVITAAPLGIPVITHRCPPCVMRGLAA